MLPVSARLDSFTEVLKAMSLGNGPDDFFPARHGCRDAAR